MQRYEQRVEIVTARCGHAVSVRLLGWESAKQHATKLTNASNWFCPRCSYEAKRA